MNIRDMVLFFLLQTSHLSGRRHRQPSSSEEGSIENLLYFKESKMETPKPPTTTPAAPVPLRAPMPQQPACACPKMCCSMCCECNDKSSSYMLRQMDSPMYQQMAMQQQTAMHKPRSMMNEPPVIQQHKPKNRKPKAPPLLPPIGSRRDMGSTKDHIKGLISRDEDIKKILRDLVKVTIQKVSLLEELDAQQSKDGRIGSEEEEMQEFDESR